MERLDKDDYTSYLIDYYKKGLARFGDSWRYADIVTTLLCLSDVIMPVTYLEIGVRRGRSVCAVASKSPDCDLYMFDQWKRGYAGMENPGPDLVMKELDKIGHKGERNVFSGNSHTTLKEFFKKNNDITFDMITVDGDHSYKGAVEDLCDVLPRLKIGGAVIFDDICHPKHLYLNEVWKILVETVERFASWRFGDTGYGVGFALRKW
jgi:predicted O-methyltransferase YrrM